MRIVLIAFAGLLAGGTRALAQAPTALLKQTDALVGRRQYATAFALLDKADTHHTDAAILLKQEDIALRYYLISLSHQAFGLRDLKPGETVEALRGKPDTYQTFTFPVRDLLTAQKKAHPTDYRLDLGLGDYYYAIQQCHCGETDRTNAQLMALAQQYYSAAHAHGQGTYMSYYALGYFKLLQKDAPASIPLFEKSLALRSDYVESHYNLACALSEMRQPAAGLPYARFAMAHYPPGPDHDNAVKMVVAFENQLRGASPVAGPGERSVSPGTTTPAGSYTALKGEVAAAVAAHSPQAPALTDRLFRLNPNDEQVYSDLMGIYEAENAAPALLAFFTSRLPTAPPTPKAQGYLHLYAGILAMQLGQLIDAQPHFVQAKNQLRKVLKTNDPAFRIIQQSLGEGTPR